MFEVLVSVLVGAVAGIALWSVLRAKDVDFVEELDEAVDEFVDSIPTLNELKKMTKAQLTELVEELGLEVNVKAKKSDLVEEIDKKR